MSKLLALLVLGYALTGCGIAQQQVCGPLDLQAACHTWFGPETENQQSNEQRLAALEVAQAQLTSNLNYLYTLQGNTDDSLASLQTQIDSTLLQLASVQAQVDAIEPGTQVSLRDPCPNVSSVHPKEKLIVIGSKTIAYFEDGGKRFLSELVSGVQYQTTDKRACTFTL